MNKPTLKTNPDLDNLKQTLHSYVEFIESDDYHEDNDYAHYIYEEALITFFGEDFFKYLNSKDN